MLGLAVVAWDSPRPPRPSPTTKHQIVERTLGPGNSSALPAPCPHKARHLRHEALLEELLVALEQRRRHLLQVCGGYTLEKHEVRSFSEAPGFCPISKQKRGFRTTTREVCNGKTSTIPHFRFLICEDRGRGDTCHLAAGSNARGMNVSIS